MISESMSAPGRRTLIEERANDIIFTEMMYKFEQEMLQTKEFQEALQLAKLRIGRALQPEDIFDYPVLQEHFTNYIRTMLPVMMFDIIVSLYQPLLYALAMRILGNHHNAEDVVQESLIKAYVALKGYSKERLQTLHIRPWLCAIVRNTANNYRLYERRLALLELTEDFPELEGSRYENPETALIFEEKAKEILEVIRHLSPKNRAIIILRYWYDLSYEEIATVLDYQNLNTLKSRLHRGLKALGDGIAIGEMV